MWVELYGSQQETVAVLGTMAVLETWTSKSVVHSLRENMFIDFIVLRSGPRLYIVWKWFLHYVKKVLWTHR